MKRTLSLTLAIIMIVCTIPTFTFANVEKKSDEVITLRPARLCEFYAAHLATMFELRPDSYEVISGEIPEGLMPMTEPDEGGDTGVWDLWGTPEEMGEFYFEIKFFKKGGSEYGLYKYQLTVEDVIIPAEEEAALYENFENGATGWQMLGDDVNGKGWEIVSDEDMAYEGKCFVSSETSGKEADTSGNWLVSPVVFINDKAKLTWYSKSEGKSSGEYDVYVCYGDMDADVSTYKRIWTFSATDEWKPNVWELSLSSKQNVRIAFKHYSEGDASTINLDFITLSKGNEHDKYKALKNATEGVEYKDQLCKISKREMNDYEVKGDLPDGLEITFRDSGYDVIYEISGTPTKPGGHQFLVYYYVNDELVITILYSISVWKLGDINYDGIVNTGDASELLLGLVYPEVQHVVRWEGADVNKDGVVNTGDAIGILKMIVD